ncbi:hypothetical protein LUZ63_012480 [Rhynchospora breviuscula]|uniref:C2 domain-containing protein n=1 Tax=Rhynchospora breviuscula TaxID=2022672 RepID=A0A9Q0CLD1_9POAL|nr:hypothetical protein LUZ63_012480 [Rhynchospora breviuscula]
MKVAVEVIEAANLLPKDSRGASNPFVEIHFNNESQRTQTRHITLDPSWTETFVFSVPDSSLLANLTITASVLHDSGDGRGQFMGQVVLSGSSLGPAISSSIQWFPLEKRFFFSRVRGELCLRAYYLDEEDELILNTSLKKEHEKSKNDAEEVKTNKQKEPVTRVFQAVAAGGDKKKAAPAPSGKGGAAGPAKPDYNLIETSPSIPALTRERVNSKISSTYDLVEVMQYLFVYVVKARDLPTKDITGFLDPFVEVKLGNYKGITKILEKNNNPVWGQVFAFSQHQTQADTLAVIVKDKDDLLDDIVGRVKVNLTDIPHRTAPDGPIAPLWRWLEYKDGTQLRHGEINFAVWFGTQADEAFPDAWQSDAHDVSYTGLINTRSKVYFSPRLAYLRVSVLQAQDLVPVDKSKPPNATLKVQYGQQSRKTRPGTPSGSKNPTWNEDLLFVACPPFKDQLVITVEDSGQSLGRLLVPLSTVARNDQGKRIPPKWYNLLKPGATIDEVKREERFSSKLHLKITLDTGYHVIEEPVQYSSNFQPASKKIQKSAIGLLELGVLSARNLTGTKAPYCVARYGLKWIRTRTVLNTTTPRWNEQFTWEVFDPCTILTVAVFENCHISDKGSTDKKLGKVRIRISTLQTDKVYTHFYPLFVLQSSGLKKNGELHLAVRFTCTAWANMLVQYGRPLLPKMHYSQPISIMLQDQLRSRAVALVTERLGSAEPPLRKEVVDYIIEVPSQMWSMRKSKANFYRVTSVISSLSSIGKWINNILQWKNPFTTLLVHVLFITLVFFPELILPTVFLYLFAIGLYNYRFRPSRPPHLDPGLAQADVANSDELDEEFDTFPTTKNMDLVRMRYDRLRTVWGRIQTVAGDIATQGERFNALLSWRDLRATRLFIIFSLLVALVVYVTPFQVVALLVGLYILRHPKFRSKSPSPSFNFYKRLPSRSDMLL